MAHVFSSSMARRNPAQESLPTLGIAELMGGLLPQLGLAMPAGPVQDAYTLHFDTQPSVHVVHRTGDSHVALVAEAGVLPAPPAADKLAALLALNYSDADDSAATVALHPASGTVVVCSRLRHAGLDVPTLKMALDSVRRRVDEAMKIINGTMTKSAPKGAATRTRLGAYQRQF